MQTLQNSRGKSAKRCFLKPFFRIQENCDRKVFNLYIIMYMESAPDHLHVQLQVQCNYNLLSLDTYAIGTSITCTLYFNGFLMFPTFFDT